MSVASPPLVLLRAKISRLKASLTTILILVCTTLPLWGEAREFSRHNWLFEQGSGCDLARLVFVAVCLFLVFASLPVLILAWGRVDALIVAEHGILVRRLTGRFIARHQIVGIESLAGSDQLILADGSRVHTPSLLFDDRKRVRRILDDYVSETERARLDRRP